MRRGLHLPEAVHLRPRLRVLEAEVVQAADGGAEDVPSSPPAGTPSGDSASERSGHLTMLLAQRKVFLRFLARRTNSPSQAEDILQSAYLRALEHASEIPATSAVAWFYRVLRNAVIDSYRRRGAESRALELWAVEQITETPASDPFAAAVCGCMRRLLPGLTPSYAEILTEVDLNEGDLQTFASARKLRPATASVRLHRARRSLRKRLLEVCGACASHQCTDCTCHLQPAEE